MTGGSEPLPEDAEGAYSREQLELDAYFCHAVERAIANGSEGLAPTHMADDPEHLAQRPRAAKARVAVPALPDAQSHF